MSDYRTPNEEWLIIQERKAAIKRLRKQHGYLEEDQPTTIWEHCKNFYLGRMGKTYRRNDRSKFPRDMGSK